jgi:hypothetical protein
MPVRSPSSVGLSRTETGSINPKFLGQNLATQARAAHGYEPTREAANAAFAKSWRRD